MDFNIQFRPKKNAFVGANRQTYKETDITTI